MNTPHPLRQWCIEHDRSLSWVARKVGVSRSSLNKWLKAEGRIDLRSAVAIERLTDGAVLGRDWLGEA